ncbi:MAG: hypothetical protein K2K97_09865 [Muribaculaceae bacterium]|nr:hypothetical protein [Muribaculaceae bacterium]
MNMHWNHKQKLAVLKSLCYIVGADRKIMPQEMQLLQGYLNRVGLTVSAMNEQAEMSQSQMQLLISQMSASDKKLIASFWKQAMMCDNHIADEEIHVIMAMAAACQLEFADVVI